MVDVLSLQAELCLVLSDKYCLLLWCHLISLVNEDGSVLPYSLLPGIGFAYLVNVNVETKEAT